jgi:hypothetical protein
MIAIHFYTRQKMYNKPKETNQKPASGFLIAHFKRYTTNDTHIAII